MAYENQLPFDHPELCSWLRDTYGLVVERLDVRPGYMSTVVFVHVSSDVFVLKCVRCEDGAPNAFNVQVSLVDHLAQENLPVATCLEGADGQRGYVVDSFRLSLWHFLKGEGFCVGDRDALCSAGETLGKTHRVLDHWDTPSNVPVLDGEAIVHEVKKVWAQLEGVNQDAQKLVIQLRDSLTDLKIPSWTPTRTVIHGDFRAQNLLFQDHRVSGILDWDNLQRGPFIFDVAYALIFFQAVLTNRPQNETGMLAFLQGYTSTMCLSEKDLAELGAWLHLALLKGLTLWAQIFYLDGVSDQAKVWLAHYLPLLGTINTTGLRLKLEIG